MDDALSPALRWSIYSEAPESEAKPQNIPQTSQKVRCISSSLLEMHGISMCFLLFERFCIELGKEKGTECVGRPWMCCRARPQMAFERSGDPDFRGSKVVLFDETFKQNGR